MRIRKFLWTGIAAIGLVTSCSYNAPLLPPAHAPQKKQESYLEDRIDPVYLEIDKNTEHGVPTLYVRDSQTNDAYMQMPVAIGNSENLRWETPSGTFEIAGVFNMPIWYPPEWSSREGPVMPGEDNPFGEWMFPILDADKSYNKHDINTWGEADHGYRIHSTTDPESVGKKTTHGCVRVHPNKVDDLASYLIGHMTYHGIPDTPSALEEYEHTWRGEYMPFERKILLYIHD